MTSPEVLTRWAPERLRPAAARTRTAQAAVEAVLLELSRSVGAALFGVRAWSGLAAVRCQAALDERQAVLQAAANRLGELAVLIEQAATQLADRLGRVREARVELDSSGAVPTLIAAAAPVVYAWQRHERIDALDDAVSAMVATDRRLGGELQASARAARSLRREHDSTLMRSASTGAGRSDDATGAPALPPASADPEDVADWWAGLRSDERAALEAGRLAADLGGRPGLPAAMRDRINRRALAARLAAYDDRGADDASRAAHQVDLTIDAELRRLADAGDDRPVRLLLDRPREWGKGRAAIAVGDPDTARNVAYLVPGLDDRVTTSLPADDAHALAVLRASGAAVNATAVVTWLGYQTPVLRTVASSASAERGATLLAEEVDGLLASRGSDHPHVTLVGHSYGSTTAALATSRSPGTVDDLVLVGSPGAEADRAGDLPVPQGHVWVGASDDDLVTRLGWFGPDPAGATFGAHRFPAEVTVPGEGLFDAHGHYFDQAGQSLAHVGQIVAGQTSAVPTEPGR